MRLPQPLSEGVFLRRLSRFTCLVEVDARQEKVHLANSGRLATVLLAGRRVWLQPAPAAGRQTRYDLALVDTGEGLVSVDARVPEELVGEALEERRLPHFQEYVTFRRGAALEGRRLDFRLSGAPGECLLEVKSCTLVHQGRALFPDAPTLRGMEHLKLLARCRRRCAAAVVFVVQMENADSLSPNSRIDPAFGAALQEAHEAGVLVCAFKCKVTPHEVELAGEIPVYLSHPIRRTHAPGKGLSRDEPACPPITTRQEEAGEGKGAAPTC